jgi:hypothetical protein
MTDIPDRLRNSIYELRDGPAYRPLLARRDDLVNVADKDQALVARLIAIALEPPLRRELDEMLDRHWGDDRMKNVGMGSRPHSEIIIGSGYHAAVYCAVRAAMGAPRPLVIERDERAGGVFACSQGPTFYLNSRNRAGLPDLPGQRGGLNAIPGALIQPSMLSAAEYQSNADMAFAIRLTLAMHAKVALGKVAVRVRRGKLALDRFNVGVTVVDTSGREVALTADRLIDCRGIGSEREPDYRSGGRILTFSEFMAHMETPFPLRALKRVAVIGGGDAGKCAVEAIFGLGPARHWSIADLDPTPNVDWYCQLPKTCEEWRLKARSRYRGIGALLPRSYGINDRAKLTIRRGSKATVGSTYDGATVQGRRYDMVVFCAGYERRGLFADAFPIEIGGQNVALRSPNAPIFCAGPQANLPFTENDEVTPYALVPENRDAMWRLGPYTATFAASFPIPEAN